MGLVDTLILGALTLLFGTLGAYLAVETVREVREAARVLAGPEEPPDCEGETYLAVTLADAPGARRLRLAQVHDTFGYWLARYGVAVEHHRAEAGLSRLLLRGVFGVDDYRETLDRRRGWTVAPGGVVVRDGGERRRVAFGDDVLPLQRLEADGATVPFLAHAGGGLGLLFLVVLPVGLFAVGFPLVTLAIAGVTTAALVGAFAAGKAYHDTGAVGGWEVVAGLDDGAVPDPVAALGDAPDPDRTAKVNAARAAPGDTVRVVGTVEATEEGLRVTDGVVSTRGQGFLAAAAAADAVRTLVFAVVALLVAAGGAYLLAPSVAGRLAGLL
jgi:hypothetical protein